MSNLKELTVGSHLIFKKEDGDDEECAKIKSIEKDGYAVKQYFNQMMVTGLVEFSEVIRVASDEDLKNIKGSKTFDLKSNVRRASVVGFQSNLMKDRNNNNNNNNNNNKRPGRLRGLV